MSEQQDKFQIYEVLGIPISVTTLRSASDALVKWSRDSLGRYVGVRDVASLMAMQADPDLVALSRGAAMNVPDGMPLVWIGRYRGLKVERTCGPDLMEMAMADSAKSGLRHFFYGGKEGVADTLATIFRARFAGVKIVGTFCPPFQAMTPAQDADVVALIKNSAADVVWVGLSSPKQDIWARNHVRVLPQTLVCVGAAFDFHTKAVARAPKWMRRSGLEWLHRLISEPRRLWRRYLILAPLFVWKVLIGRPDKV